MARSDESKLCYVAFLVYEHGKNEDGSISEEPQITIDELSRRLTKTYGQFLISPLHQPDDETDDTHWHVIYRHPGPIYPESFHKFVNSAVLGVPVFNEYLLCLHHHKIYQRYLLHLDNPEKEQFVGGSNALTPINSFPVDLLRELSTADKIALQMEVENLAVALKIHEYARMTLYLAEQGLMEHYHYFTTHTHHFAKFLDSLRYDSESQDEDPSSQDEEITSQDESENAFLSAIKEIEGEKEW